MFTIKFYSSDGCRQIIEQADSFTVLRSAGRPIGIQDADAEITMHRKHGDDNRIDIGGSAITPEGYPPRFAKAIIENAAGKTTEIIGSNSMPPARVE